MDNTYDQIVEAIEEISYPVTEETIGDLTIKEFENLLIDLTDDWVMNTDYVDDNEVRLERFDEILERATFRETIVNV